MEILLKIRDMITKLGWLVIIIFILSEVGTIVKEKIFGKQEIKKDNIYTGRISKKYPESNVNMKEIKDGIQKNVIREEKKRFRERKIWDEILW